MCRRVTNKGRTNYMDGIDVAKLNGMETETANPVMPRTDLCTLLPSFSCPRTLPTRWSPPCSHVDSCAKVFYPFRSSGGRRGNERWG
jgi:hypothetical protein